MMAIGPERFMEFLDGMHRMDLHFRQTPLGSNMPVILGLLAVWYINFFSASSQAVIPYDHYLRDFPVYLQQLEMESSGKSIDRNGRPVDCQTGVPIWGQPGTDGQHAFFQLLHQGTQPVPCDFIGFYRSLNDIGDHHKILTANFFAQTDALAFGRTREELIRDQVSESLIPFLVCPGNKPTTSIMARRLTPGSLGKLIALYEHKVFVMGIVWNINSFDQWGVELGKQLSAKLLRNLDAEPQSPRPSPGSADIMLRYFRDRDDGAIGKD
jgi:glucose-6-phosphate isomerase